MTTISRISASPSFSFIQQKSKKSHCITECFWKVIHTLTAIVTEFTAMIYSASIKHRGNKKDFNYYNLNPLSLTKKEAKQPATLILHGLYHNQTGALAIAKELQKNKIGPVFTVNLKYSTKNPEQQHKKLRGRLKEIRALYEAQGMPLRLNLIGHSYGTKTAVELIDRPLKHTTIEKIISIAGRVRVDKSCHPSLRHEIEKLEAIIKKNPHVKLYHLVAAKDYLLSTYSAYYSNNYHIVKNRSHLGILYAKESLRKIVEYLQA